METCTGAVLYDSSNSWFKAISSGHKENLNSFVTQDMALPDPFIDILGQSALHIAAIQGDLEIFCFMENLLKQKDVQVPQTNHKNETCLMLAVAAGNTKLVHHLLHNGREKKEKSNLHGCNYQDGVFLGAKDKVEFTCWLTAAYNGHTEVLKILFENGCDINGKTRTGSTGLALAASNGHLSALQFLVQLGADMKPANNEKNLLMYAIIGGDYEVVKYLVEYDREMINGTEKYNNMTPLLYAAGSGNIEIVKLLIEAGASLSARTKNHSNCLHEAAKRGCLAIVEFFVAQGVPLDMNKSGLTPLACAIKREQVGTLRYLVSAATEVWTQEQCKEAALKFLNEKDKRIIRLDSCPEFVEIYLSSGWLTVDDVKFHFSSIDKERLYDKIMRPIIQRKTTKRAC